MKQANEEWKICVVYGVPFVKKCWNSCYIGHILQKCYTGRI